jgi:hypothetical protein
MRLLRFEWYRELELQPRTIPRQDHAVDLLEICTLAATTKPSEA